MNTFLSGLGQFVGVFLGVIAGVAVTLAVEWLKGRAAWKQELRNLKFELEADMAKLRGWLEDVSKWRNAVNGDAFGTYYGYLVLSSAIVVTTNSMFFTGKLYKVLTYDHIVKLQEVFKDLCLNGEQCLNGQIREKQQMLAKAESEGDGAAWSRDIKRQCIQDIDYWERKLKDHLQSLGEIAGAVQARLA